MKSSDLYFLLVSIWAIGSLLTSNLLDSILMFIMAVIAFIAMLVVQRFERVQYIIKQTQENIKYQILINELRHINAQLSSIEIKRKGKR